MFVYERKARYHETDKMGIIHHSNYIKWMEEARTEFMEKLGMTYKSMEDEGVLSPVTSISINYKNSFSFDDTVLIEISVKKYSGVILRIGYTFFKKGEDKIYTEAESEHCFIRNGKIISLKRELPHFHNAITEYIF